MISTTACIVGAGPAGAMLSLLLARAGVEVVLLEKHKDFLRDFRGDTVHPATLQVLDELALISRFERLPHRKVRKACVVEGDRRVDFADFGRLKHPFPYVGFVPQWEFLNMLTDEAASNSNFRLLMQAEAQDLVRDGDRVTGVRFRSPDGEAAVRATLTVAADGRHSTLRRAAGLASRDYGMPMDVVNFRVSRRDTDPHEGLCAYVGAGTSVGVIDRGTYWHVVYEITKGTWTTLPTGGVDAVRRDLAETVPFLADRVDEITTLGDLLEVRMDRLGRWHMPGLLLIGDAAHAMSPVGGFGVNLAIQDAVATANLLTDRLLRSQHDDVPFDDSALAAVRAPDTCRQR
jgi:2-polyprenyl-6-methoxyphenol hydroxylase-like FAD-dependent oxidoreductase